MEYITEEIRKIAENDLEATFIVKGKLFNVHGEWAERTQTIPKTIYKAEDTTTTEHTTSHPTGDRKKHSTQTDVQNKEKSRRYETIVVKTFPRNGNGDIGIPIGGVRGYISGMFRASARNHAWNLKGSGGRGMLTFIDNGGISVGPQMLWIPEKDVKMADNITTYLIQNRNVFTHFDTLLEAPFEAKITVTKRCTEGKFDRVLFLSLLADLERLPVGAKRRGSMKIDSVQSD